jgi:tRNA 2-thiouridine synthesizing protein A
MDFSTLDCRGMVCPIPIVNLAQRMKEVDPGFEVEFFADDLSCVQDLPAWCGITGNVLVSLETVDGIVHAFVRRT